VDYEAAGRRVDNGPGINAQHSASMKKLGTDPDPPGRNGFPFRVELREAGGLPAAKREELIGRFRSFFPLVFTSSDSMFQAYLQWTDSRVPELTSWAAAMTVARRNALRDAPDSENFRFEVGPED